MGQTHQLPLSRIVDKRARRQAEIAEIPLIGDVVRGILLSRDSVHAAQSARHSSFFCMYLDYSC